jgi:hypothetical protein
VTTNQGDLSRCIVHEPAEDWPTMIEVVAYWSKGHGRRGRRRSIQIDADQFFGRGRYGAPMPAEVLFGMVERLRRQGPDVGLPSQMRGDSVKQRKQSVDHDQD